MALLVGSFVIYNTFSITVAQRTRETALLRAIGAKRKQVMRSLVFESVLTGLFASAIGVVAGIGTAKGIAKVFTVFDIDLPASGTVVNSSTIVISMVVGTVVTVLAAYMPARKAGKVPPIAALRDVAHDNTGTSVKRAVFGTLLTRRWRGVPRHGPLRRRHRLPSAWVRSACSSASRCSVRSSPGRSPA